MKNPFKESTTFAARRGLRKTRTRLSTSAIRDVGRSASPGSVQGAVRNKTPPGFLHRQRQHEPDPAAERHPERGRNRDGDKDAAKRIGIVVGDDPNWLMVDHRLRVANSIRCRDDWAGQIRLPLARKVSGSVAELLDARHNAELARSSGA